MKTKENYLDELNKELDRCAIHDKERYMEYYEELIMDAIEDGNSEEEVVMSLDEPSDVVKSILYDKQSSEDGNQKKKSPLTIALLIIGAPLWVAVLATLAALALTGLILVGVAYLLIWLVPFMVGVCTLSFAAIGLYGFFGAIPFMMNDFVPGLMQLGIGIFSLGASVLCFYALKGIALKFVEVSAKMTRKVRMTIRRGMSKYGKKTKQAY